NRAALIFQTDPVDTPPVAAADKSSVPVWATGGRIQLSIEDYVDCVLIARPNGVQAPTDNDTLILPNSISRKRCWNSVMRTARYLETVRECRCKNSDLSKIPLLVSIAGGNDLEIRKQAIKQTDFSQASGVVIDGISTLPNDETAGDFPNTDRDTSYLFSTLIPGICTELPPALPRFITGIWQPKHIALAARAGVDLFDGSLPYRLTRSAVGWIYPGWSSSENKHSSSHDFHSRYLVFPLGGSDDPSDGKYETPIQPECKCFTCTHHSRGYVSHMHIAKEMLGPMLLMIHNSHQCYRFFRDLRHCLASGQIDQFVEFSSLWEFPAKLLSVDRTFESKTANNNPLDDVLPVVY
ncbi:Queuine tRNA-ribosyltransferase, partial [Fasciolopsis buskii]